MKLRCWRFDLKLAHRWTVASALGPGGNGGKLAQPVLFVELLDADGLRGWGEAAPSARYGENVESANEFVEHVDPAHLSFADLAGSTGYLRRLLPGQQAAKAALNLALVDGAARLAGKSAHDFLGLPFTEGRHLTSLTLGLDAPDVVRQKAIEAAGFPILKLKVGGPADREVLRAVREVAPDKPLRVDANEAWTSRDEALRNLEWLATDGRVQFVEQPMPASTALTDLVWLKERSPLPLFGDESYRYAGNLEACREAFHGVNVKLVKAGGITVAMEALKAARQAGLQTMLGCMVESSLLITAAAHLAELTDHLDLDGNLLVTNDPFEGVRTDAGRMSLAELPSPVGLGVRPRFGDAAGPRE